MELDVLTAISPIDGRYRSKTEGPASFHDNDYTFYYNNIKENVAKRIATYKANH